MKDDDKTFEAYFSGNMPSSEANDFSTALENNLELKESYDLFIAAKKAASMIERDKMRAELEGVDLEKEVEQATRVKAQAPILKFVKWGGSIAALIVIAFFSYNSLQPPSNQDLFAANFETYKVQATRGGGTDAIKAVYSEGKYDDLIAEALTKEESPELNMMIANAYLNSDKFDEAIKTLTKISDNSSLRDQKYWYLALSLLKTGKTQEAIRNFEKLLAISNYKKQETEEILSKIDH